MEEARTVAQDLVNVQVGALGKAGDCATFSAGAESMETLLRELLVAKEEIRQLQNNTSEAARLKVANAMATHIEELDKVLRDVAARTMGLERLASQENQAKNSAELKAAILERALEKALPGRAAAAAEKELAQDGMKVAASGLGETAESSEEPFWSELRALQGNVKSSVLDVTNHLKGMKADMYESAGGERRSARGESAVALSVLFACRAALAKGPVSARAALKKYRSSIDPALAGLLEIVGNYEPEVA